MVAYMHSPETLLGFDVYQFSKEGFPETPADFAQQETGEYNAFELFTNGAINGIPAAFYRVKETYEDQEFITITYILEDGSEYIEISFRLGGDTAEQEMQTTICTLTLSPAV